MENVTPTSPAVTLGPPAEASSPPGVSPGPQMFPMSPSAEGQDHTSVVPSSSLVPSLANAPVLSVRPPYACSGSQRDVTQALWAQYGPTTTSVRSVNPMSQPYRDFSGHSGDGVTAGQSGDGGRSSQDVSGVGGSGQGRDATYGLPPNWDWNIPPPHPPQAQGVDPVLAGLMQQQLQLGQTLIDVMRRGNQQQQPQQPSNHLLESLNVNDSQWTQSGSQQCHYLRSSSGLAGLENFLGSGIGQRS